MGKPPVSADSVRHFANQHYVEPARTRGEPTVTIAVAEIHDRMEFESREPLVCTALGAAVFEELYRVRQAKWDGPKQGRRTQITFAIRP
jgi:hypothetical protein